jgi:hypothetical protein
VEETDREWKSKRNGKAKEMQMGSQHCKQKSGTDGKGMEIEPEQRMEKRMRCKWDPDSEQNSGGDANGIPVDNRHDVGCNIILFRKRCTCNTCTYRQPKVTRPNFTFSVSFSGIER